MEYENVKSDKIDQLPFIDSSLIENGAVKSFVIKFGGKLYSVSGMYGITISQQKPDKIVEKFKVSGEISGIEIKPMFFEDRKSAQQFVNDRDDAGLTITVVNYNETKGEISQDGAVLRATDDDDFDGMPF